MATVNDKIKKILAMIDGATTEGEARAASLALQRLLVANDMTLDEISLSDDAPEINETGEDVGKRVAIWVKALAYVIASNYRCESYFHVRHERDFWTNRQKITSKQVVFVGEAEDSVVAAGCFRATRQSRGALRHMWSAVSMRRECVSESKAEARTAIVSVLSRV